MEKSDMLILRRKIADKILESVWVEEIIKRVNEPSFFENVSISAREALQWALDVLSEEETLSKPSK